MSIPSIKSFYNPEKVLIEFNEGQFAQVGVNSRIKKLLVYQSGLIKAITSQGEKIINNGNKLNKELISNPDKALVFFKNHFPYISQFSDGRLNLELFVRGLGGGGVHPVSGLTEEERARIKPYLKSNDGKKNDALDDAISKGDAEAILILLKAGANPNYNNRPYSDRKETCFVRAVQHCWDARVIEEMLKRGANPNDCLENGTPVLCEAISRNNTKQVMVLLNWGANPNCQNKYESYALEKAIDGIKGIKEFEDVCLLMLEKGANPHTSFYYKTGNHPVQYCFLHAIWSAKSKRVTEAFIQRVKFSEFIFLENGPLSDALSNDWDDLFMMMLEKGADPKERQRVYGTVLNQAISMKKKACTEALIRAGADVNSPSKYGEKPLNQIIQKKWNDIVELIINKGASINVEDEKGLPICCAIHYCDIDSVQLLINCKADLNQRDKNGRTPISYFIDTPCKDEEEFSNLKDKLQLIIQSGGDVNGICHENVTPLGYFFKYHLEKNDWKDEVHKQLLMLLELGADPLKIPSDIFGALSFEIQDLLLKYIKVDHKILSDIIDSIVTNINLGLDASQKNIISKIKKEQIIKKILTDIITESQVCKMFCDKNSPAIVNMKKSFIGSLTHIMNQLIADSSFVNSDTGVIYDQKMKKMLLETIQEWRASNKK